MPFIIIALILAAVIGGGTSFAAQNALPGEPLWGFKTEVLERLQPGDDIVAIQTRLQEAKTLSARGKLNTAVREKITANITAHAAVVEKQIIENENKGDYAAASTVATNLQAVLAKGAPTLDLRSALDAAAALSAEVSAKLK